MRWEEKNEGMGRTGLMQASKIGAGNAMALNAVNMRRTSTTLLVTQQVLQQVEQLREPVQHLQSSIVDLLLQRELSVGRMPLLLFPSPSLRYKIAWVVE